VPAKKKRKRRNGKEERKTYVIKFSSCGSFQELPPLCKIRKIFITLHKGDV
jgi:hypothetical protein